MKNFLIFVLILALVVGFLIYRAGSVDAFVAEVKAKVNSVLDLFESKPAPEGANVKIPGERIYFTAPEGWNIKQQAFSTTIQKNKDSLVSIAYNTSNPPSGDYKNKVKRLGNYFAGDASSECSAFIRNQDIKIASSKKTTVAGYNCLQFTGTIWAVGDWDCHVYGYVFVVDDVEIMVCGLVASMKQETDLIVEIDALTDQIAKSVQFVK